MFSRLRRSSLKKWGRSEGWLALFLALDPVCGAPFGARCSGVEGRSWVLGCRGWVDVAHIRAWCVPVWSKAGWLLGHPFAA